MTTLKQRTANRHNAQLSSGPATDAGKAVARMNALAHGLRAASPVMPGEDPAAWEEYREAVVSDLNPAGVLETELADRVAVLSWRLRRVSAYEAGVVARASDKAARVACGEELPVAPPSPSARPNGPRPTLADVREAVGRAEQAVADGERLAPLLADLSAAADGVRTAGADALFVLHELADCLPDDGTELPSEALAGPTHPRFLLAVGVPAELRDDPEGWCGWTAGAVRAGAARIARAFKWAGPQLLARADAGVADLSDLRAELADARRELAAAERRAAVDEGEARRRALVPGKETVDVVMKYEGHLQRQLTQTQHELERRQALRSDCPPHPPAALDVTVHPAEGFAALLSG